LQAFSINSLVDLHESNCLIVYAVV